MAQQKKYKDIGKKDIIGVINQLIRKMEAIEMTLNILILKSDEYRNEGVPTFQEFTEEKLKEGANDAPTDEKADGAGDTASDNKD